MAPVSLAPLSPLDVHALQWCGHFRPDLASALLSALVAGDGGEGGLPKAMRIIQSDLPNCSHLRGPERNYEARRQCLETNATRVWLETGLSSGIWNGRYECICMSVFSYKPCWHPFLMQLLHKDYKNNIHYTAWLPTRVMEHFFRWNLCGWQGNLKQLCIPLN